MIKELLNSAALEAHELCASVVARALELLRADESEPQREPLGPYWMVAIDKPNGARLYLAPDFAWGHRYHAWCGSKEAAQAMAEADNASQHRLYTDRRSFVVKVTRYRVAR